MKLFVVLAFLVVSALAVELPITDLPEWWAHRGLAMPQNRAGRIVGGNEAGAHQFPYQVGLRLFIRDSTNIGLCGGSFLTQTRVLSAAHCVDVVSGVESVFGAHVMNNLNEPNQQRRTTPESGLIWHAEYDPQSLVNDVAIIHLVTPVIPNAFIQTVRLPEGADLTNEFNGELATASGWGRFSSENVASTFLRFVEVNVMTNTLCRVRFPTLIADSTRKLAANASKINHDDMT